MSGAGAGGGRRILGDWPLAALLGAALLLGGVPLYHALPDWWAALERDLGVPLSRLRLPWDLTRHIAPGLAGYLAAGWLCDRLGPRPVLLAGLFILAGAWALFGLAQNLPMYHAAIVALAVGASLGGWIPVMALLCRRFARRRAAAIAVASAIAPVGALAVVPFIAWGANPDGGGMGWRLTALAVSGCALIVAAAAFARLRHRPYATASPAGADAPAQQCGRSTLQALRTRAFWLIVAGGVIASYSATGFSTFILVTGAENYFNLPDLARILALESSVSVVFYIVGGLAGDRYAKHKTMAVFALLQAAGFAAAVIAGGLPGLYLCSILMGMGTGGQYPLSVAIIADYFGMDSFGKILGLYLLLSWLLTLNADSATILIYTILDSYPLTLLLLTAPPLLGAFLFLKAHPPPPPNPPL